MITYLLVVLVSGLLFAFLPCLLGGMLSCDKGDFTYALGAELSSKLGDK